MFELEISLNKHQFHVMEVLINRLLDKDGQIESLLQVVIEKEDEMSAAMDRLLASVRTLESAADSMDTLLKGLAQQIRDTAGDAAAAAALADEVDAKAAAIAADVAANT